jgi:hypothetical protein
MNLIQERIIEGLFYLKDRVIEESIAFWHSPWPGRILRGAKVTAIVFSFFLALSILIIIWHSLEYLRGSLRMMIRGTEIPKFPKERLRKKWESIERKLESREEAKAKLALIEADKLIDNLLKQAGYRGKTMTERLEQITPAQISNIDDLWQAHKLRNRLVHDSETKVAYHEIREAVEVYKKVLEEFEVLW